ncbi:hypothetical protein S7S_09535 [Isoalcanivorax pacificus W11-5]|uniref:Uncharacterized protein n=1 Tax=Isoalcanivorax pacificus W11-5 TaxID=391936 RepID=A0A0B4XJ44_9GAMM|nr:hypothetical protein [Isoalcanivorax pacificus]AJD48319.1 hypothetical protein S7S_09535 [Isoalcanivorax pacificus W11-5]
MSSGTDMAGRVFLVPLLFLLASLLPAWGHAAIPQGQLPSGLQPMEDSEMAGVVGQALIVTNKVQGDGEGNGTSGLTFYSAGLDAELRLNLNIERLELGRTGPGALDVDILAEHVMFGCTANAGGECVDSSVATQLRDFIFNRPFFQFAIENDDQPAHRRVVGVRLGAENAEGPLSIGEFKVFSGYLSAVAEIELLGQDNVALTTNTGYSPTGTRTPAYSANIGLSDWCLVSFIGCLAWASQYQVYYPGQSATYPVLANGSRIQQAQVHAGGANSLYNIVDSLTQEVGCRRTYNAFGCGLGDIVLGLIATNIRDRVVGQLGQGLGVGRQGCPNLNDCNIPFNISNLHRVEVDSPLFGLSFQERSIRYPGYAADVPKGWAMYLPDAFTLQVSEPMTVFTQSILSGNALAGNLVPLDPVFDNCWGSATFC